MSNTQLTKFLTTFGCVVGIFCLSLLPQACSNAAPSGNTSQANREQTPQLAPATRDGSRKYEQNKSPYTNKQRQNGNYQSNSDQANIPSASGRNNNIPQKALTVLAYIRANNRAPEGYVGGRHFGNFEKRLAEKDANGRKINYQEWDVNPKIEGKNRGTERLITGSDGTAWYTNDHYNTFKSVQ